MKNLHFSVALSIIGLVAIAPCPMALAQVTQELVSQSTVIFKGQVEKAAASNLKLLPASSQTVLVRVDEVLSAAKTMPDLKDAQITIQLREPNSLKAGDRATFFTTGWLYGENIALKEVAHLSADLNSESLSKQISDLQAADGDQKVEIRIQHAAMVIAGKVLATHRFAGDGATRFNSEHDPEWWTADIEVQSYLKGQPVASGSRVTVLYANSHDVMWLRSPKLKEGDQAIWIVAEYKPGGFFPETRAPILAVLSYLDSQPLTERGRLMRLVKANQ